MFLAAVCGYAIVAGYIGPAETAPQNLGELARETANGESCSLYVFPMEDVFSEQEKALAILRTELEAANG